MKQRRAYQPALIVLVFLFAVTPMACASGGAESAEQEEDTGPVTRTVVANPEEMQQAFMDVADQVLPSVVEVNVV